MIPGMANYVVIDGADHGFFGYYSGSDYVDLLISELTDVAPQTMNESTFEPNFEGIT